MPDDDAGLETVAISTHRAGECYHRIDDTGTLKCGPKMDWDTVERDEAEARGYTECKHCAGDVISGNEQGLRKRLLELDPSEVGV